MWTYDEALTVMRTYIEVMTEGQSTLLEEETCDKPYGWIFFYQSKRFQETGNWRNSLLGNAPFIFNRVSGEISVTGTAHPLEHYVDKYERSLPPAQLEMTPQRR